MLILIEFPPPILSRKKINPVLVKIVFIFLSLVTAPASAQLLDSIQKSVRKKPKFDFWLESRNSFVSSRRAEMRGIKVAAAFNKNFYVGGGLNFLKSNDNNLNKFSKNIYVTDSLGMPDTVKAKLQLIYLCYFLEYVFYKTHKWEFSVPVQIGFGGSWYEYEYNGNYKIQRHPVILYEPALSGEYMIFKWFGVGANLGFRLMLVKNKKIPERFTSPLYTLKTNIYWGELYKLAFPKSKFAKRK
jgi:hypothetical protein